MWMRQSLICLIGSTGGLHQSQQFWQKYSATPRKDDISEEKWMAILQNLREEDVEWRAPWLLLDEILYRCDGFNWVPLLAIWGAVGYTLLLLLR
ncbi:hypothetical protein Gotur_017271 [Gossypium turneri]